MKQRPPLYSVFDRLGAVFPAPYEYGLRIATEKPFKLVQAHQAPRGAALPMSRQIHGGNTISRLPDIAFQPESCLIVRDGINNLNCNTQFIAAPIGTYVVFVSRNIPLNRKLIVTSCDLYSSNPYYSMLIDAVIKVNNAVVPIKPAVNRPCSCPYPMKIVVNSNGKFTLEVAPMVDGYEYGTYSAVVTGYEVDDSYPIDQRFDL